MGRYPALAILILILAPLALVLIPTAVVKAQTTAISLGAGRPVTLEATFTISPGDAIAPHLYTWYFDGVNDYLEIPHSPSYATARHSVIITFMPTTAKYLIFSKGWWNYYRLLMNRIAYLELRITRMDKTNFIFPNTMEPKVGAWTTVAYWLDENNAGVAGAFKDGAFYTPSYTINSAYPLCFECPNPLRIMGEPGIVFYPGYVARVLIYSQILTNSSINNMYTYNIINASGLSLFLDPTFYNGTHYIDLSGYNNHGIGYNEVTRAVDSRTWLYLIKGRFSDGYVHFMFFPLNSVVYIYDSSGNLVTSFMIKGNTNVAGLVQDYPVSLTAGTYKVVVYTYQDYTIFQNSGTSYTRLVPRYAPGSQLRLMINATTNIQAIRYQIATDPNFNNIAYDNTITTSNSYIDITLPNINNTYYLRVAVQFTGGTWSPWSNTYQFRVDWLIAKITAQNVYSTSSAPNILFNVTYTDKSYPYAPVTKYNATIVALGKYNLTSYWWRVDIYKGATTSAEPPNPSYYTYLGTVYTIHPYFSSYSNWGYIPSSYTTSYIFQGVADSIAPYWASAVGAPSTNFAFVYQSFVYLPLSGTYTIEVYSNDGVRVYINGSLVIDKWQTVYYWQGITSASTSINLNAGWYNITVKYFQAYDVLGFYLGIVLPNGTAIRPLVPIKGVKMVAPQASGAKIVLPSVGTALVPVSASVVSASGSIPVTLLTAGAINITLIGYDYAYGYSARASTVIRFGVVLNGYSTDFVSNKVTVYIVDGLGRSVDTGYINVSDSGSVIGFVKVSSGKATVSFNRFANGTLAIVDPGDNSIIFSNPSNGVLLYKNVLRNRVSAVGTQASQILGYRELPGLVYVKAELKGNASILTNTSLPVFLVKVNGVPTNNYVSVGTNILFTNLGSTVEVVYANSTTAVTNIGAGPGGGVFLVGFADTYNLTSATYMIGLFVNGSVAQPFAYIGGSWRFGNSFYVSFPMVPMLSFGYEGRNLSVYWVLAQARGYATGYSKGFWVSPITANFTRMYPFLMVLNQSAVAERFGVIPSAFASYLAKNAISLTVLGPHPARLLVTTVAVMQPIQIIYTGSDIKVSPSTTPGITFVGFKGFRLSIAVGNIQLQNIEVSQDPMTLYLPTGFTALLVVDTSAKTISLTQMALPQPPGALTPAQTSIPILAPPPTSAPLTEPAVAIQYTILVATFTGIALAIWRRTGDFGYGVAVAGVASAIIGLVLGNGTAVAISLAVMGIGIAVSIAERRT